MDARPLISEFVMHYLLVILFALAALASLVPPTPPPGSQADDEFVHLRPGVGDPLPDLLAYTADGGEFRTSDLRGHYAVLTFGCLT